MTHKRLWRLCLAAVVAFAAAALVFDDGHGRPVVGVADALTQPNGPSGSWTLVFDDEFNGSSLDATTWTPGWFGTGITGPINSSETACYNAAQATEPGDGSLHLQLVAQPSTCSGTGHPYTGAMVSSNPDDGVAGHVGFQVTYGYVEYRAYLPAASVGVIANWPGTFSTGQNWPTTGENDTMEGLSGQACFHFHSSSGTSGSCVSGDYTGWHTFASDWEPGVVTYYYDGVQVGQITSGITSAPMYLAIDNTTSATSPTLAPATMLVDYVRVWQQATTVTVTPTTTATVTPTTIPTTIATVTPTTIATVTPAATLTSTPTAMPTSTPTAMPTSTLVLTCTHKHCRRHADRHARDH